MTGGLAYSSSGSASFWLVDPERRLHVVAPDGAAPHRRLRDALRVPIPGVARPAAVDLLDNVVVALLDSGETWRLDVRAQRWRPLERFARFHETKEADVGKVKDDEALLVAGGNAYGGGFWYCDRERRLWLISAAGARAPFADAPVPGSAVILAADAGSRQVLCGDGMRFGWTAGRWIAFGTATSDANDGASASMQVRALRGFCIEAGRDVQPGDVFEVSEARARELMRGGKVEPAAVHR